ncbi:hypothetical protein CAEBREN_12776 [Caenorhabditis brenneri]|uniref:Uncharacterized protein n=1 Tax=Caenorhabditis brenneri TaxID=135651 RepID=G0NHZ6_CAEBE|nr:hypothetical protein CAEBREN_12776 [Caenorhabditis brenneri]
MTLAYVTFITTQIILDCKGLRNDEIPGNHRLCEDVSLLLSFNKPSNTFLNNIINSYTAVISEMQSDVSKWNSEKWSNVKTSTDKITMEKREGLTGAESIDAFPNEKRKISTSTLKKLLQEEMETFISVLEVINKKLETLEAAVSKLNKKVEQFETVKPD